MENDGCRPSILKDIGLYVIMSITAKRLKDIEELEKKNRRCNHVDRREEGGGDETIYSREHTA